MSTSTKKVFISYSWAIQEKVIELAERLIVNGVDVIMDVYDLKEGQDKYAFMEQSVTNPEVDRVLIICDKTYQAKADNRAGGVGDETVIISPEIYGKSKQEKFIPVAVEADENGHAYIPAYIKSRIYIDLTTEDDRYESEYEKLLRNIYEAPLYKKPVLGKKPEWLENTSVDLSPIRDLIKQVRGYTDDNPAKADFILRKAADEFVIAAKQYQVSKSVPFDEGLLAEIEKAKIFRDAFLDYCESLLYSGLPVANTIAVLFERLYNGLHDASRQLLHGQKEYELCDYMIWELFITATALLLHYEKYADIYSLLTHTYFLRQNTQDSSVESRTFLRFRPYFRTIEEECKPKSDSPKRFTMAGDMLIHRERKPILTKESIANADLLLYQLGCTLHIEDSRYSFWFPTTYVYHNGPQPMWQKLKSRAYCTNILPLFGAKNIDELKKKIDSVGIGMQVHYNFDFNYAAMIKNSINVNEIGSLN